MFSNRLAQNRNQHISDVNLVDDTNVSQELDGISNEAITINFEQTQRRPTGYVLPKPSLMKGASEFTIAFNDTYN